MHCKWNIGAGSEMKAECVYTAKRYYREAGQLKAKSSARPSTSDWGKQIVWNQDTQNKSIPSSTLVGIGAGQDIKDAIKLL